jgi:hypothetical protein
MRTVDGKTTETLIHDSVNINTKAIIDFESTFRDYISLLPHEFSKSFSSCLKYNLKQDINLNLSINCKEYNIETTSLDDLQDELKNNIYDRIKFKKAVMVKLAIIDNLGYYLRLAGHKSEGNKIRYWLVDNFSWFYKMKKPGWVQLYYTWYPFAQYCANRYGIL